MSKEIHLVLTGLTCPACVRRVDQKLRAVPGVTAVQIDLPSGRATVTRQAPDDESRATAELIAAVERAGYGAQPDAGAAP